MSDDEELEPAFMKRPLSLWVACALALLPAAAVFSAISLANATDSAVLGGLALLSVVVSPFYLAWLGWLFAKRFKTNVALTIVLVIACGLLLNGFIALAGCALVARNAFH